MNAKGLASYMNVTWTLAWWHYRPILPVFISNSIEIPFVLFFIDEIRKYEYNEFFDYEIWYFDEYLRVQM